MGYILASHWGKLASTNEDNCWTQQGQNRRLLLDRDGGEKAPETEGRPGEEAAQQRIMSSVKSMVVKVQLEQLSGVISDSSARPQQQSASDLLHMARRPRPFIRHQSLLGIAVFQAWLWISSSHGPALIRPHMHFWRPNCNLSIF